MLSEKCQIVGLPLRAPGPVLSGRTPDLLAGFDTFGLKHTGLVRHRTNEPTSNAIPFTVSTCRWLVSERCCETEPKKPVAPTPASSRLVWGRSWSVIPRCVIRTKFPSEQEISLSSRPSQVHQTPAWRSRCLPLVKLIRPLTPLQSTRSQNDRSPIISSHDPDQHPVPSR